MQKEEKPSVDSQLLSDCPNPTSQRGKKKRLQVYLVQSCKSTSVTNVNRPYSSLHVVMQYKYKIRKLTAGQLTESALVNLVTVMMGGSKRAKSERKKVMMYCDRASGLGDHMT